MITFEFSKGYKFLGFTYFICIDFTDLISKVFSSHGFHSSQRFHRVLGSTAFTGFIKVSMFRKFVDFSGFLAF